jgi:hypothetical protein
MDSIRAVSSPQIYAPAPTWTWILKLKSEPKMFLPSNRTLLLFDRSLDALNCQLILTTDVDVAFVGTNSISCNGHRF